MREDSDRWLRGDSGLIVLVAPLYFCDGLAPGEAPEGAEHDPAVAGEAVAVFGYYTEDVLVAAAGPGGGAFEELSAAEADKLKLLALGPSGEAASPI